MVKCSLPFIDILACYITTYLSISSLSKLLFKYCVTLILPNSLCHQVHRCAVGVHIHFQQL